MATAYTPILKLALPVTGELNGTWGTVVNDNITSMVEQAVAGLATINTWAANSHTLTTADGTTSESRCAMLVIDDDGAGNPSAAATVICPTATKSYIVRNLCGQTVTVKTSAGTGVAVPNNQAALVFCDGTNVVTGAFNGDVVGPATSTNNAIVTFDGTTGKIIKDNSGATISAGVITATGFSGPLNGTVGATTPSTVVATQVDITAQGDLRLQDTTGGQYVALQAPGTVATSYTLTLPVDDGTSGQALITDGSGVLSWSTAASGDVYGPASATDNAIARYDGTTGKIIQNSAVTIADDGATVIAANSTTDGLRITQTGTGNALLVEDAVNPDATPTVIAADGSVSVGSSVGYTFGASTKPSLQVNGLTSSTSSIGTARWQTGISPSSLVLAKSRSGTVGTQGIVSSGDSIGSVTFDGDDGTAFISAATITAQVDGTPGTNDMPGRLVFSTTADGASSPTERMRINNAGRIGFGATDLTLVNYRFAGNVSGGTTAYMQYSEPVVQSGVTSAAINYSSVPSTAAAAFTLNTLIHFSANQGTIGAGSTVTNQIGFNVASTMTGATNNYGFYSNIPSGTGRWNFYAAGTANNYFAGNTGLGTDAPRAPLAFAATVGTAGVPNKIRLFDDGASNFYGFGVSSGSLDIVSGTGGNISLYANGATERMRIASGGTISLGAAPGAESLRVNPVASAVNYLEAQGAITSGVPIFRATGSDTNVPLTILTKGTGYFNFQSGGGTQFFVGHTASAVNYLQVTGGATGAAATLSAQGSDTNIDLALTPKGTGNVRFGTHTGTADVAITGYIEVKDSAGNVRKLAVIT